MTARGLTEVKVEDLKKALQMVHRGELAPPLVVKDLARVGLQHCAEPLLRELRGLDVAGIRAVLVCVIAERAKE
ncbi:MAG: hypothetical protein ACOZNI_02645 [Myxococcota bacterium]